MRINIFASALCEFELEAAIESDTAPLNNLVKAMVAAVTDSAAHSGIHCLQDPTRGGVATALNEIARAANLYIEINEAALPVRAPVQGACEILGLDPLYVANEGKLIAIVDAEVAALAVAGLRAHPYGRDAAIIGEVKDAPGGIVAMVTGFGGTRIVDMLVGEQLPRIC